MARARKALWPLSSHCEGRVVDGWMDMIKERQRTQGQVRKGGEEKKAEAGGNWKSLQTLARVSNLD